MIEREFIVIAIHGEGDRDTVNSLQTHRNNVEVQRLTAYGQPVPAALTNSPDEQPDVLVVLRDADHEMRIEWPVKTWDEVEQWKQAAGWDAQKRHWGKGARVVVQLGA